MERCILIFFLSFFKNTLYTYDENSLSGFEVTILSFLLGCMPNITRNAIVNCAELVTYDIIKELILKYDLMTGELVTQNLQILIQETSKHKISNMVEGCDLYLLFSCRQPAVPLHSCLRCRILHHSGGFSRGRSQNTVHEFRAWPVQQRYQLCYHHAET